MTGHWGKKKRENEGSCDKLSNHFESCGNFLTGANNVYILTIECNNNFSGITGILVTLMCSVGVLVGQRPSCQVALKIHFCFLVEVVQAVVPHVSGNSATGM